MKLVKTDASKLIFHLTKREKRLLMEILKQYPLVPESHHRLSKPNDAESFAEEQRLLEEALRETREQNKRQLDEFLADPSRFHETQGGLHFFITPTQIEWLLQVLNDIRIGSWIKLGSPNLSKAEEVKLSESNVSFLWSMEVAGMFEAVLIGAAHGHSP